MNFPNRNPAWKQALQNIDFQIFIEKGSRTSLSMEGFHRQIRKVTKTKGAFTNDMALLKLTYLATRNIVKKWNAPIQNWGLTVQQLALKFEGRIKLDLWW